MRSLDSIACGDPGARAAGRGLASLSSLCSLIIRPSYDDHTKKSCYAATEFFNTSNFFSTFWSVFTWNCVWPTHLQYLHVKSLFPGFRVPTCKRERIRTAPAVERRKYNIFAEYQRVAGDCSALISDLNTKAWDRQVSHLYRPFAPRILSDGTVPEHKEKGSVAVATPWSAESCF